MSRIKEAYEQFMAVIQEETGGVPDMDIWFHCSRNHLSGEGALNVAEIMAEQFGINEIKHSELETCNGYNVRTNNLYVSVFYDRSEACIESEAASC